MNWILDYAWIAIAAAAVGLTTAPWHPRVIRSAAAALPLVGAMLLPVDGAAVAGLVFCALTVWTSWRAVREWTDHQVTAREFFGRIRPRVQIGRCVAICTTLVVTTVTGVVRLIMPKPADEARAEERREAAAKDREAAGEAVRAVIPALQLTRLHILLLASTALVVVVLAAIGAISPALAFCLSIPAAYGTATAVLMRERRSAILY